MTRPPSRAPARRRRRRAAGPSSWSRGWPAAEASSATRGRPRSPGRSRVPSGCTSSTSTPRSAAGPTASCWPTSSGALDVKVEMSGGIRDAESLEAALATGCRRVNLGTAALEDPEWTARAIAEHGDRVAVGLDVRGTTLAARGWTKDGGDLWETLARLDAEGCARYVVTDVNKDGMLKGPNLDLLARRLRPHRPSRGRVRRRLDARRHRGDPRPGAGGRRGRDRRVGALPRRVHAARRARRGGSPVSDPPAPTRPASRSAGVSSAAPGSTATPGRPTPRWRPRSRTRATRWP